ncbi:MAG: hypothetical protein KDD55_08325, partial [Bdellovibrionales bacterium]|nr:hypothetical protein [Bdellovibrionales bacterium]
MAGNAFAVTPPELAGSLQGQFEVNNSGAATYGIDIAVPPGTNGMEPKLALVYSSSSGAGPFGPGWSITGLSEISRCPTTQGQDGYSGEIEYSLADRFCLDGQRLIAVNGDYGVDGTQYRTRIETFARVYSHGAHLGHGPEYFSIEFKNGLTYRYGYTSNSRQENINTDVVVWSVDRISDRSGNYMSITYDQDIFSGAL